MSAQNGGQFSFIGMTREVDADGSMADLERTFAKLTKKGVKEKSEKLTRQ